MTGRGPQQVDTGTLLVTATAAAAAGKVTAMVNGYVRTVFVARDLTVASGDVLMVVRYGGTWLAIGRYGTSAPAAVEPFDPGPDPNPPTRAGSLAVLPVFSGSYRDGAWHPGDITQGIRGGSGNSTGGAFYGTKPTSLVGATITAARLRIARTGQGTSTPTAGTLRLITEQLPGGGAPTLTSTTAAPTLGPAELAPAFDIPTAWVTAMIAGTAGGIGVFDADGSPWIPYAGRGSGGGFTLTIDWER